MSMDSSAIVIGAGALGSAAALTLASGGTGRLTLVDGRRVTAADLGHAALLSDADLGAGRAGAAAARLRTLFPATAAVGHDQALAPEGALGLLRGADVVLVCDEDLAVQFLAGDAALRLGIPHVVGGALRTSAQVLTVRPGGTGGCLRCLFEAPPPPGTVPPAGAAGVLGAVAATAGALMGAEALRLLAHERGAYEGRLLAYEALSARSRVVAVPRRAGCPACAGEQPIGEAAPRTGPEAAR